VHLSISWAFPSFAWHIGQVKLLDAVIKFSISASSVEVTSSFIHVLQAGHDIVTFLIG